MAPKLFALTARFQNALDAKRSAPEPFMARHSSRIGVL